MHRAKAPSPSMGVALLALFVALGGSGYAAVKINGKNITNKTITGAKLKNDTLSGAQIRESGLTKVRAAAVADRAVSAAKADSATTAASATSADTAGTAATATNAVTAATANALSATASAAFVAARRYVTTGGLKRFPVGTARTVVLSAAPFSVDVACVARAGGNVSITVGGTSTEANSLLNSITPTQDNAAVTGTDGSGLRYTSNENIGFAAPSGATLSLVVQTGVNGLGTDCFFSADGFVSP